MGVVVKILTNMGVVVKILTNMGLIHVKKETYLTLCLSCTWVYLGLMCFDMVFVEFLILNKILNSLCAILHRDHSIPIDTMALSYL